jgi:tetratricopeptide (TPR) repeat protein
MKIRNLSMLGVLATALTFSGAQAAETVIGGGAPQACYEAAENGWDARQYIAVCNEALVSVITQHDRAATLVNRGILKLSQLNAHGSLADFDSGLAINANMAEGYVDRGASLILMKRYKEALENINKGLGMKAKKPQLAYYDRGLANEALGNIQAAYEDYRQAQVIDPFFELPAVELKRFKVVTKPAGT